MAMNEKLPNTLQLIFWDRTGSHIVVNNTGDFQSLMTIAIGLQNTGSAGHVRIVEIIVNEGHIKYEIKFEWKQSGYF